MYLTFDLKQLELMLNACLVNKPKTTYVVHHHFSLRVVSQDIVNESESEAGGLSLPERLKITLGKSSRCVWDNFGEFPSIGIAKKTSRQCAELHFSKTVLPFFW